ncbi:TadE family protein [Bosea sp. NPDC003192]|jgi:Flp pilus assembly protein TadG|uniref:TadE family protein n=1 Tax=Bosea sp. NPDC003192 TaxID=3390551 RepID=UPI003CFC2202
MKLLPPWRSAVRHGDRPAAVGTNGLVSVSGHFRRMLRRRARAFRNDNAGATAVEFGLIGLLFLTVLMAILQFALLFLSQLNLENALADAATGNTAATYANNRTVVSERICDRLLLMDSCATKLLLEMQPLKNYAPGQAVAGTVFTAGGAGEMTLIRARAPVITIVPGLPQLWVRGQALFMRPA